MVFHKADETLRVGSRVSSYFIAAGDTKGLTELKWGPAYGAIGQLCRNYHLDGALILSLESIFDSPD